ncbi:hypothetical protein BH09ACT4_BH09ACT4_06780 [soil metagenome]
MQARAGGYDPGRMSEAALATTAQLRASGLSQQAIADAVARGDLQHLRRGIYAVRHTAPNVVTAARLGGTVSCASALAAHGVWTMPSGLHVRVPADSLRATAAHVERVHRRGLSPGAVGIDPLLVALEIAAGCLGDLALVVAIDSALHLGLVSMHHVEGLLLSTGRGRRLLGRIDGRAESGIESIARVRLRARGIRLRTQVRIDGVGRVDILIGDRLVVELDGEQWHDRPSTFESDRVRDAALVVKGYLVLRYSYRRVMDGWPAVQAEILSIIRRDAHVRRTGRERRSSGYSVRVSV